MEMSSPRHHHRVLYFTRSMGRVLTRRDCLPTVCPCILSCLFSHCLSADHIPAPTGTADPPIILRLPGILWCVGGHLSHAQICRGKGKRKKKPSSLTPTGSESAIPVCPLRVRDSVPLGLRPLRNRPESASGPSTVDFTHYLHCPSLPQFRSTKIKTSK